MYSARMSGIPIKTICIFLALSALGLLGCGTGSGLPPSSAVTLTLTPMQSTTPAGGTVALQAIVSGFTLRPYLTWWMQEQHDAGMNGSEDCDDITPANQNLIPTCRFGYITVDTRTQNSSTATYHAPQTPGTYHVTFWATQISTVVNGGSVEKRATASITVQ